MASFSNTPRGAKPIGTEPRDALGRFPDGIILTCLP